MASFQNILNFLEHFAATGSVLITGDFNLPDINWSTLTSSSSLSHLFCEFVFDNNLTQLVEGPTHCKGNCLDLVLTNSPDIVSPIDSTRIFSIESDHFLLSFSLYSPKRFSPKLSTITRYVPDLSKLNYSDLADYL